MSVSCDCGCCQVKVSASGRSPDQRNVAMSLSDLKTSVRRLPLPTLGCCTREGRRERKMLV
jgi:hypothetical protein